MKMRFILMSLLVVGIGVVMVQSFQVARPTTEVPIVAEDYIVAKTTKQQVSAQWTPVMLYALSEDQTKGRHLGCGTFCVGSEGEIVITSEHLFPISKGTQCVAFRKLRPFESDITHSIHKVLLKGNDLAPGTNPDVVVLGVGDIQPIQFYSHQLEEWSESQALSVLDDPIMLTSLISGEKVRLVGLAESTIDRGVSYGVIEYGSIRGESGTGFVDAEGNLFVLKGGAKPDVDPTNGKINVKGGISFVYGPISVR